MSIATARGNGKTLKDFQSKIELIMICTNVTGARRDPAPLQTIDDSGDQASGGTSMGYIRGHEEEEGDDRRLIVGNVSSSL